MATALSSVSDYWVQSDCQHALGRAKVNRFVADLGRFWGCGLSAHGGSGSARPLMAMELGVFQPRAPLISGRLSPAYCQTRPT